MSNHISYLDIPLVGSLLKASFVAKQEVASWPLFGYLAKLQQTEFIERRRGAITAQKESMNTRLAGGRSLIIFPEGTSTDGQSVLPFKSSLFSLALDHKEHLWVQPVTIKLISVDGRMPDSQELRDLYSWHRDMDTPLARHLWRFAGTSGAELALIFHEPLPATNYDDRKTLAKACHDNVSKGLKMAAAA